MGKKGVWKKGIKHVNDRTLGCAAPQQERKMQGESGRKRTRRENGGS